MPLTSVSAEKHLGCIAQVASNYWYKLPYHVKQWYGMDDMIADCALQITAAKTRYDSTRSRPVTFVYTVARNHCRQILEMHRQEKRTGTLISIDTSVHVRIRSNYSTEHALRRKQSAELLLQVASDDLRRVLSKILENQKVHRSEVRQVTAEARALLARHSISAGDVVACFSGGH